MREESFFDLGSSLYSTVWQTFLVKGQIVNISGSGNHAALQLSAGAAVDSRPMNEVAQC